MCLTYAKHIVKEHAKLLLSDMCSISTQTIYDMMLSYNLSDLMSLLASR